MNSTSIAAKQGGEGRASGWRAAACSLSLAIMVGILGCAKSEETPETADASVVGGAEKEVAAAASDAPDAATTAPEIKRTGEGPAPINGNEWPSWRGPENTGASRVTGTVSSWTKEDENLIWKAPVGGRSTPIIMDGRIYVIRLAGDWVTWQEEVVCLDADTGEILWRHPFDVFNTTVPADRVGWTSMVGDPETGYVYAHGVQGMFFCFDRDGKVIWQRSFSEENGQISGYGGRTNTPIIDGELVIMCSLTSGLGDQSRGMPRYWAMDKRTGEFVWWTGTDKPALDTFFSVPAATVVDGVRMIVAGSGDGFVHALKSQTGEKIWSYALSRRGLNSSIVLDGTKVYATHSEENLDTNVMGTVAAIDITGQGDVTDAKKIWRTNGIQAGYASPVLVDNRLFVIDNAANMHCIDTATGENLWEMSVGKTGWGSAVYADGKLYVPEVNGKFFIIEPGETEGKILSEIQFGDPLEKVVDIRGCPAIAYGRMYVMTREALYCVGGEKKTEPIAIDPLPPVGPADNVATHVQVYPAEVQIARTTKPDFKARLFDAKGRLIGDAENVTWSVQGLKGEIDENGVLTVDPSVNGQFGLVKAVVKQGDTELTNTGRVRVHIDLPMVEDFESIAEGANPNHWVGASPVKMKVIQDGDNKILEKNTDERFQRALVNFGPPEMTDYTISADVKIAVKRRRYPDIGLVNNRYTFEARSSNDDLRIVSWVSMPRIEKSVPFTMEPDTWYTMKCRVDVEGDKAIVRGKIWKRGEAEPEAWTVEMEDPNPHKNGSPGLTVFAQSEAYYDNVKVEKNS